MCTCKEKCAAGAVDTSCPVCKTNLSECAGREKAREPEPEPEQPKKKSGSGLLAVVALVVLAGGGAFAYVKFIKPNRSGVKVSADPDEYDFPDEEYINEDEPAEAETEAEHAFGKLIIAEKPFKRDGKIQNTNSHRPCKVLYPGPMAFMRAADFSFPGAWGTWYPRWTRAAMTNASKNGAMRICPSCRSPSATPPSGIPDGGGFGQEML